MLETPELWDTCRGELLTGSGSGPRDRCVLQSTKLKGVEDLKSTLTSDKDMQNFQFAQLVFGLVLVQYFLIMFLSLCFWNDSVYLVPLYVGSM